MNLVLLFTALIFLINPSIAVFDLLPDFFAWVIILKLIGKAKYLSVKMSIGAEYALKAAWVGFARIVAFFLIPYVDGTMELTFTFVFCILELVWGIPAIKAIVDGVTELSELYGGTETYKPLFKLKSEGIRTIKLLTVWFWSLKAVFNLVPEFFELSGQSSDVLSEGVRPLISFKPLAYYFTIGLTLVFGIVLALFAIAFFKRVYSDKPMLERINAVYTEKYVETGIHNARVVISSLMLITVAGLFVFSLMLDSMNVMPRFLFPLLVLYSLKGIKSSGYKTGKIAIASVISVVLSTISYVFRWIFVIVHGYYSIYLSFEAYDFFILTSTLVWVEMISFAVLYFMIARLVLKIAADNNEAKVHMNNGAKSFEKKEFKNLKIKVIFAVIFFVLGLIAKDCAFAYYGSFSEIWMVVLAFDFIWFILSYLIYNDVKERIENKYLI